MIKHILTLCLFTLFAGKICGQSTTSQQLFFEKVHLRTDRQVYLAGEDLWFSAFLINAQNNRSINTSNTLYVEFFPIDRAYDSKKLIVKLEDGKGHGDFKLDDELKSGTYILRAWTNWMRNFGDNFIFEKEIKIVAKPQKDVDEKNKMASPPNKNRKPAVQPEKVKTGILFLPEGGSLVADVSSVIAFKTPNKMAIKGTITNGKGELITTLENEKGIGTFLFKPVAGETYQAEGHLGNGESFKQSLPAALTKGYGMYVIEKDSLYQIIISTNAISGLVGKDVLLAGKSHGLNCFNTQFTMRGLQQTVSVYKSNFPEGIASITLYDSEGRPNCERLVYVDYKSKPVLSISTEKPSYGPGETVRVNLKVSDADNNPLQGSFSIASLDDDLAKSGQSDIVSYLMLESELKGKLENPKQYFDVKNANRKKQLDLLMLTQGWRDFLWKRMADTAFNISQIPESGITISGSVKRKIGDAPIANSNVTIRSTGQNQSQLLTGVTNEKGTFFIDGFKFTGEQKFAVTAVNKKIENEGWIKLDPLFKPTAFKDDVKYLTDSIPDSMSKQILEKHEFLMKKKNSMGNGIMLDEVKIKNKSRVILGNTVLNKMGYIDEEFVISARDSDYQNLSHYLLANSKQALPDPSGETNYVVFGGVYPRLLINNKEMFFMDDVVPADYSEQTEEEDASSKNIDYQIRNNIYDTYLNLPMSEFKHVTIKHMVGMIPGKGPKDFFLVYLTLQEGTLLGAKGNPISVKTSGYYQAREFNPEAVDDKKTDESFTFFWNPLIKTDLNGAASFSFKSPAEKMKLRLAVEGLESNGNPLAAEQIIEINK